MKRSMDRILTTHTGSLPRPPDLTEMLFEREDGKVAPATVSATVHDAVAEIVRKQAEVGVDVLNDGELSKIGYSTYVKDRLTGFGGESSMPGLGDMVEFPTYQERMFREMGRGMEYLRMPACTGPIALRDREQVRTDIENLRVAVERVRAEDVFMTAASPGVIALFFANQHYPDRDAYLGAIADAMRDEYEAIVGAGFVLQLDCPDLAMGRHIQFDREDLAGFRREAERNVEALNQATAHIDPDQMRMHLCWGNYEGPHHRDVGLHDIVDIVFRARPNGISVEACNPRHEHEWQLFEDVRLPDGKLLIPGVIDSTNNYIEHPDLVTQRLVRYARLVGQENVLAGTDCGFGTFAGVSSVDPNIVWAKFGAMAEGARLASQELKSPASG
ncbi:MAG: cobalamin-independent methionine synthase II family protein [bacterium]|jgi:5-methyltetrahydropteroyltriglutamate--homocysteine methyltransferase|nr:cobalamin-independent methionine synthase II family protein [bacterium]